jgi:hypothetical protein
MEPQWPPKMAEITKIAPMTMMAKITDAIRPRELHGWLTAARQSRPRESDTTRRGRYSFGFPSRCTSLSRIAGSL